MHNSINILNVKFTNASLDDYIKLISSTIKTKGKCLISSPNVHICNVAKSKPCFARLINKFSILHPDGVGVYIASKILYGGNCFMERSTGTDLYYKLFNTSNQFKYFLIGGVEDCAERIKNNFTKEYDSFKFSIVGSIYKFNDFEKDISFINNSSADILLVALGTPFQEEWIIKNSDKIKIPVIIAVGSGLDFLAGVKKRAPLWMRILGLEWFYRLLQEPRRLWKRYIIGIPIFMFHIFIQKVKLILKKDNSEY